MTLDQILKRVYDDLAAYAADNKGKASIARDPLDPLEVFMVGPEGFRLVVSWAGDQKSDKVEVEAEDDAAGAGEEPIAPAADQTIEVWVGHSIDMTAQRDFRLIVGRGSRLSILGRVDAVRARLLSMLFPDDQTTLRRFVYQGTEPVITPDKVPLAAFKLRVQLTAMVTVETKCREV